MREHSAPRRSSRHLRRRSDIGEGGDTTSPIATLLALQQSAGNRAVTQLVAGGAPAAIQRQIDIAPADLAAHGLQGEGTYGKIILALTDMRAAPTIFKAGLLRGLCEAWLDQHETTSSPREAAQKSLVENLQAQAHREAAKLRAEKIYLRDFLGGKLAGPGTATTFAGPGVAQDLASGKTVGGGGGGQEAVDLIAQYKLSAAEIAAVRTYTLGDYLYINPATANADAWMASNIDKYKGKPEFNTAADPKKLKSEGAMHAGVLMQALAKIPVWKGTAYRGTRTSAQNFAAKYTIGCAVPFGAFTSAAKLRHPAQKFADGEGGSTPGPDEDVSVLFVLKLSNARDVSKLSAVGQTEEEVLLLPGAKLTVQDITPLRTGPAGYQAVPAKAWFIVRLVQVA